jgi:hypothetical protein
MSMELPKIKEERNAYENLIRSSDNGKGTIYAGIFYRLEYQSHTPDPKSLKCEGVQLTITANNYNYECNFAPMVVPFKEKIGLIDTINGRIEVPFKIRLAEAIATMKNKIIQFDDHNRKVKETAEKVVQCKANIDNLISEITGGQSIPCSKMLEESNVKELLPATIETVVSGFAKSSVAPPADKTTPCYPTVVMTELERKNKMYGINVAVDQVAQSKRANDLILDAKYSYRV